MAPSDICRAIRTVYVDELPVRLTMLEVILLLEICTLNKSLAAVFSSVIDKMF